MEARGLALMPAPWLYQLVRSCEDARVAARLACTCKLLAALIDDQALWRSLVMQRFGPSVLPGLRPEPGTYRPAQLEGWLFYQGVDGSEESDDAAPAGSGSAPAGDLPALAAAARLAGAEAFTTSGKLVRSLKPQAQWARCSFHPCEGMYVSQSAAAGGSLVLPPSPPVDEEPWPPQLPGWTYFPAVVSQGHFAAEPRQTLTMAASLGDLLRRVAGEARVVAVTTKGELKGNLRPQASWSTAPRWDAGLLVKDTVVADRGLVPSPPEPDHRALYAKLDHLRLDPGQMEVTWLNDQYLALQPADDAPSGLAVQLNFVCWLELGGTIHGVRPGRYDVLWAVDLAHGRWEHNIALATSAAAHPNTPPQLPPQQRQAGVAGAEPAGAPAGEQAPPQADEPGLGAGQRLVARGPDFVHLEHSAATLQALKAECRGTTGPWAQLWAGELEVSRLSSVRVRMWAHDGSGKHAWRWAGVQLRRVASPAEQAEDARLRAALAAENAAWRQPQQQQQQQQRGGRPQDTLLQALRDGLGQGGCEVQ